MMTAMFVNLPVTDLERAKAFYTEVGFTINPLFTDHNAACVVVEEDHSYFMLLVREYFQTFSERPIGDPSATVSATTAIMAICGSVGVVSSARAAPANKSATPAHEKTNPFRITVPPLKNSATLGGALSRSDPQLPTMKGRMSPKSQARAWLWRHLPIFANGDGARSSAPPSAPADRSRFATPLPAKRSAENWVCFGRQVSPQGVLISYSPGREKPAAKTSQRAIATITHRFYRRRRAASAEKSAGFTRRAGDGRSALPPARLRRRTVPPANPAKSSSPLWDFLIGRTYHGECTAPAANRSSKCSW